MVNKIDTIGEMSAGRHSRLLRVSITFGISVGLLLQPISGIASTKPADNQSIEVRTQIRPDTKCKKINKKVVVKGKTLQCKKSAKGLLWREVKKALPTPSPVPSPSDTPQIVLEEFKTVPDSKFNALFTVNQRFAPEFAQTFTLNDSLTIKSVSLAADCITYVPLSYYSGMNQDHSLEQFRCDYPAFDVDVVASIYKLNSSFNGNPLSFQVSNVDRVARFDFAQKMQLKSNFNLALPRPVSLDPGFYAIVLGFTLKDPNINTIWFVGHQHISGGFPACVTNPSPDIYELGSAYRGESPIGYTGLVDNFRGVSDLFVMHKAKVQSCIVVGDYLGDVFAFGDVALAIKYSKDPKK